jgi:hypothetical protein
MDPANWRRRPERCAGGQEYELMTGGYRALMLEGNGGWWMWGIERDGALLDEGHTSYATENIARLEAW